MKEAPPPTDLPFATDELRSNGERPSDADQAFYNQAMQDKENGELSLPPAPRAEAPIPTLVPIVGRAPSADPIGDAIEAEVARINTLTPEVPAEPALPTAPVSEKPVEPAYGSAEYFAQRDAGAEKKRREFSLNPLTRAGNLVGAVTKKIGDGMAKLGGDIEKAEYERAVDAQLASRTPSEVLRDRYDTFNKWNGTPRQEVAVPVSRAPEKIAPAPRVEAPTIPAPGGPAEEKAREVWWMNSSSEAWAETESVEALAELAREIQLQEEELKIQEEELALRRKKLLLLQKKKAFEASKRKNSPVPPKGPGAAARAT